MMRDTVRGEPRRATNGELNSARGRLLMLVAALVLLACSAAYLLGAWAGLENSSVDLRFAIRGHRRPDGIVIAAIDDKSLNSLHLRWPFPRSLDAKAIDVLHADHARTIVYDVQFTQPTVQQQDRELYEAVVRAPGVVLATTEIGPGGSTEILGGNANLAAARAHPGAGNFRANSSGVIQKYPRSIAGLSSLAVAGAEQATGRRVSPSSFNHNSAWIDFQGPPGTFPTVSFSDLIAGRLSAASIAGKIVVIGATSPVLQDIHATSTTSSSGMAGPEVQANAIWTALHGNPLRQAPGWIGLLAILLGALIAPLACLRMRPFRALAVGLAATAAYAVGAQLAFDAGWILLLTYPLAAGALGSLGAIIVSYVAERWQRTLAESYAETLHDAVTERTAELQATQVEVVRRLAQAAELRDEDTGLHIERVGRLCEQLGLRVGMSPSDAQRLRIASALHDVGKIGVPDRILLKRGELSDGERELMRAHTTTGAALLSDSPSPLLQMAEMIARTHHERWDGRGYPEQLRGTEIPLVGRICAICDVFDALSARRPYKEPWPLARVMTEIADQRGAQFDPELVDLFIELLPSFQSELEDAHAHQGRRGRADTGVSGLATDGDRYPELPAPAPASEKKPVEVKV